MPCDRFSPSSSYFTQQQPAPPTLQGVALDLDATSKEHALAFGEPANANTHRAGNSRIITADDDRGGSLQRGAAAAASAAAELLVAVGVVLAIGALAGDNGRRARSTRHVASAGPSRRFERRDARSACTAAAHNAGKAVILAVLLAMVSSVTAARAPVIATRDAVARELTTTTAVSTFAELSAAIAVDGASIDVTADIAVTSELVITGSVSITSSAGAALSGGGSNRLFYMNSGASLALSSLTLSDDYAVSVKL